jgi:hypothetical protein
MRDRPPFSRPEADRLLREASLGTYSLSDCHFQQASTGTAVVVFHAIYNCNGVRVLTRRPWKWGASDLLAVWLGIAQAASVRVGQEPKLK